MLSTMCRGAFGVVLVATCCALSLASSWAQADSASTPAPSFLHVDRDTGPAGLPQIVDSRRRSVLLKGVNVDGIVDYFKPDLVPPYPSDPAAYSGGACPPNDTTVE